MEWLFKLHLLKILDVLMVPELTEHDVATFNSSSYCILMPPSVLNTLYSAHAKADLEWVYANSKSQTDI